MSPGRPLATDVEPREIRLAAPTSPEVSVVIPAFNEVDRTLRCVASVADAGSEVSFEVILMDDCSTDPRAARWQEVENLVVHRNPENLGFLLSCNRGASLARGDYLVFLNNDTAVLPGWLDELLETFRSRKDAGLVGSKLLDQEGRIQEAGGIVWRDATARNCGRGYPRLDYRYNYLREVDYCSGASIMLRRDLFLELGGFDKEFAPAYYEDTDLAFRVREAGWKVYYQPFSEVVHWEGASHGRDESASPKRYQAVNRDRFRSKWATVLDETAMNPSHEALARDRGRSKRILVVDQEIPKPDRDSGSLRMMRILGLLEQSGHKVTLFCQNHEYDETYTRELQRQGVECIYRIPDEARPGVLRRTVRKLPRSLTGRPLKWKEGIISRRGQTYDVIVLSRVPVARKFLPWVKRHAPGSKTVFDTVDLHFLRTARKAEVEASPEEAAVARKLEEDELLCARETDATVVVSPIEREILLGKEPQLDVYVISNIHDVVTPARGRDGRSGILFLGGFRHPPNVDAVSYFVREIFPLVRQAEPEIRFWVAGADVPSEVQALASDSIEILGYVPNLDELLDRACMTVAPLRYGAGVKGKITESLAHGVPVVSTSIGAEGMGLKDNDNAMLADSPEDFARAVVRVWRDAALWQRLSLEGRRLVGERFSAPAAARSIESLLNALERRS